jgi:hypothetical protein
MVVQFIYMSAPPAWMQKVHHKSPLIDCRPVLQSRLPGCLELQREQLAAIQPPADLVAVTENSHVVEIYFQGSQDTCNIGAQVFEKKYGKPTFVNGDGTNVTWDRSDFGVSILCLGWTSSDALSGTVLAGRKHAAYQLTLREPFARLSQQAQDRQKEEKERAVRSGPKL